MMKKCDVENELKILSMKMDSLILSLIVQQSWLGGVEVLHLGVGA
jgi:hypothetical protein